MTRALVRLALLMPLAVLAGHGSLGAQAPARGASQPASQPAPRGADGTSCWRHRHAERRVWIGGNLGFCNSNTVAAPASLNPGATGGAGGAPGRGARIGACRGPPSGWGRGGVGPCTPIPYMEWTRGVSRTIAGETSSSRTRAASRRAGRASG